MALSVLSDLSVRASGRVGGQIDHEAKPSGLLPPTRLEASTDKSDRTRRSHALTDLYHGGDVSQVVKFAGYLSGPTSVEDLLEASKFFFEYRKQL